MKLYGLALVKDEADVVGQSLRHALTFCDRVAVLDNGSSDDSVAVVESVAEEYPGRVLSFGVDRRPFSHDLRAVMYDELRHEVGWDGWFLQLDADEFLDSDPRPALARAGAGGFNRVATWQAQFQFTDVDLAEHHTGRDDRTRPIEQRRRYYRVDWREGRFWLNRPDRPWEGTVDVLPTFAAETPRWGLVNRHYQFRDPQQMQRRIEVRAAARTDHLFVHATATDWRSEVVSAEGLRRWEPGLPIQPWPWRFYVRWARQRVGSAAAA
jgi:hypothetical protein